jgi:hypothetical protein
VFPGTGKLTIANEACKRRLSLHAARPPEGREEGVIHYTARGHELEAWAEGSIGKNERCVARIGSHDVLWVERGRDPPWQA